MSDATTGNADQIAYWNGETTQKWLGNREILDRQMARLTELLLAAAAPQVGEHAIDIGCGTGALSRHLAAAVGPEGEVLGLDVSTPLLAEATRRAPANVRHLEGDAQVHDFQAGAFDLATSRFGIMFFADPTAAFANIRAGVRAGGRLAIACWAPLADNPWFGVPLAVAARHLGPPPPRPPRAPGPLAFQEPDYLADVLKAAGWRDVAVVREATTMQGRQTVQATAEFATMMGPASNLLRERQPSAETRAKIVAEVAEAFGADARGDGVILPAMVNIATACND